MGLQLPRRWTSGRHSGGTTPVGYSASLKRGSTAGRSALPGLRPGAHRRCAQDNMANVERHFKGVPPQKRAQTARTSRWQPPSYPSRKVSARRERLPVTAEADSSFAIKYMGISQGAFTAGCVYCCCWTAPLRAPHHLAQYCTVETSAVMRLSKRCGAT